MGRVFMVPAGGVIESSDLTAQANNVMAGYTYMGADSDNEAKTGTLSFTGNAGVGDVLAGKKFYNNDPHTKLTGTLAISGNAAASNVVSGRTFYASNPQQKLTGIAKLFGASGAIASRSNELFYPSTTVTIPAHGAVCGLFYGFKEWNAGGAQPAYPTLGISLPESIGKLISSTGRNAFPPLIYSALALPGGVYTTVSFFATNETDSPYYMPVSVSGTSSVSGSRSGRLSYLTLA